VRTSSEMDDTLVDLFRLQKPAGLDGDKRLNLDFLFPLRSFSGCGGSEGSVLEMLD